MEKYFLFFILALIAEIIGTISGFGSSILFVPLANVFFDFKAVLSITAIFHVFSNLSKIILFHKGIQKEIVLKLGIPAIIFVILGAVLTRYIPQKEIELSMNIILLILALYLITQSRRKIARNNQNLYTGGAVSGFLAGLIGTGGAVRGLTLVAFQLEKSTFIATSAVIDLGVDSSRAIVYIINGYFQREYLYLIPFLIVISLVGSWLGKVILFKVSEQTFRYLVLGVITITSILQTIKYFTS